jgi:hypothetical protein
MTHSSTSPGKLAMSLLAGLVVSLLVACDTAAPAGIDYRSRMQSHNVSAAFDATSEPEFASPDGQEWLTHIQQDLSSVLDNTCRAWQSVRQFSHLPRRRRFRHRKIPRWNLATSTHARLGCSIEPLGSLTTETNSG